METTANDDMEASLFSFEPRPDRARGLRESLEQQLCSSYRSLLETIETGLSLASGRLAALAPTASPTLPLSSHAYASHWQLGLAVESNLQDRIVPALREMSQGWHSQFGLVIATHNGDFIDRAAQAYLDSGEGQRIRRPNRADDGIRPPDLCGIPATELSELAPVMHQAAELIKELDPGMADELQEYVRQVRLVDSMVIGGMSSLRFFGTVFLSRPPHNVEENALAERFFGGLVHETSHLHLHALMATDPLVLNRDARFDSPLRRDQRPMLGIYHATFVLARLTLMFGRWHQADPGRESVAQQLSDAQTRLARGIATIRAHGQLTPRGAELLTSMDLAYSGLA
jgi:hypothetical protein